MAGVVAPDGLVQIVIELQAETGISVLVQFHDDSGVEDLPGTGGFQTSQMDVAIAEQRGDDVSCQRTSFG